MSKYMSMHMSTRVSIHMFMYMSIHMSVHMSTHMHMHMSMHMSMAQLGLSEIKKLTRVEWTHVRRLISREYGHIGPGLFVHIGPRAWRGARACFFFGGRVDSIR